MGVRLRLACAALLCASCARYEYVNELDVPGLCPTRAERERAAPGGPPAVRRAGTPGTLTGVVTDAGSGTPLVGAAVGFASAAARPAVTGTDGVFVLGDVAPGPHELVIRRLGYEARRVPLSAPDSAGLVLTVRLQPAGFDGPCSGFAMTRVRKGRWWFW